MALGAVLADRGTKDSELLSRLRHSPPKKQEQTKRNRANMGVFLRTIVLASLWGVERLGVTSAGISNLPRLKRISTTKGQSPLTSTRQGSLPGLVEL
jgi:hypothetical protein